MLCAQGQAQASTAGLSEEERRQRRAARFGIPVVPVAAPSPDDAARRAKRVERFGVVEPGNKRTKQEPAAATSTPQPMSAEMAAKLEARKARFEKFTAPSNSAPPPNGSGAAS